MEDIAQLISGATDARARLLDRVRTLSSVQGAFLTFTGSRSKT